MREFILQHLSPGRSVINILYNIAGVSRCDAISFHFACIIHCSVACLLYCSSRGFVFHHWREVSDTVADALARCDITVQSKLFIQHSFEGISRLSHVAKEPNAMWCNLMSKK